MSKQIEQFKDNTEPATNKYPNINVILKHPIVLILFSGFVGILVAFTWEYFKFKRETIFERKMDYILDSRNQAAELYISIDGVRRLIRSHENDRINRQIECNIDAISGQVEEIKAHALRVNYLAEFSKGLISGDSIEINVKTFKTTLKSYIDCLEMRTNCTCTNDHLELMNPIKNIINLHTKEIYKQLSN